MTWSTIPISSMVPRPAAVVVSVALSGAYWLVAVVGFTVSDWVRQWPVPIREPVELAGWTAVVTAVLVAVWRGRLNAIRYLSLIGRISGGAVLVGLLLVHLVFLRADLADATSVTAALPGLLGGGVLLTVGQLLRRPKVAGWARSRRS